jgi:hypothetical protein
LVADHHNAQSVQVRLYVRTYGADDELIRHYSPQLDLAPAESRQITWTLDHAVGAPIADIGVEISGSAGTAGSLYLDYLTWDGAPHVTFTRPDYKSTMWRRAWVDAVDAYGSWWPEPFRLVHNQGTGLLIQGSRDWTDYRVSADVTPHMVDATGVGARVQGQRRYYALLLARTNKVRLVKALDGETTLGEQDFGWDFGSTYQLSLEVVGTRLRGWVNDQLLFDLEDTTRPLDGGGIALLCTEGRTATQAVTVQPAD